MSFSNFEFPNTNYYNSDLRELLAMYKKLVDDYGTIKSEIDQAVEFINQFEQIVDKKVQESVDKAIVTTFAEKFREINLKFAGIDTKLEALNSAVEQDKTDILALYDDFNVFSLAVSAEIESMKKDIEDLFGEFGEFKHSILGIVDGKFEEFENEILDKITHIDRLFVINPLTGVYEGIQKVLNDIVNLIERSYGITAADYDALNITAQEYSDKFISAIDYSAKAYFLFKIQDLFKMINPWTGQFGDIRDVVKRLVNYHRGAPTATEYDNLQFDAQTYDARNVEAYIYDWEGRI